MKGTFSAGFHGTKKDKRDDPAEMETARPEGVEVKDEDPAKLEVAVMAVNPESDVTPASSDNPGGGDVKAPAEGGPGAGTEGAASEGKFAEGGAVDGVAVEDNSRGSWEGRLKKREEELAAREAELSSREAGLTPAGAEPAGEEPEMAAEQGDLMAEGEENPEGDAAKRVAEDFGDSFAADIGAMIRQIVREEMGEAVGSQLGGKMSDLEGRLNGVIESLNSQHDMDVSDGHEDAAEIATSPEFIAWVDSQPDAQKARIGRVLQNGSASAVVRVLSTFKDELAKQDAEAQVGAVDTSALEAAAGVRSGAPAIPPMEDAAPSKGSFASGFRRGMGKV